MILQGLADQGDGFGMGHLPVISDAMARTTSDGVWRRVCCAELGLTMKLRVVLILWLCLLLHSLASAQTAAGGKRVALLVGNARYGSGLPPLTHPPQDVAALEASLQQLGFAVQVVKDADQKALGRAFRHFGTQAQDAEVAFFYYSGHGMQARDENFLIPLGAAIESEADLEIEAVSLRGLMRQIEDARPHSAVVVLDACRDNPVAGRTKSATKGLTRVLSPPGNTLVVFAAQAGHTANDDGVFAQALAKHMAQPNLGLRGVFDQVNRAVRQASGNRQSIERNDQLVDDVFLLTGPAPRPRGHEVAGLPVIDGRYQLLAGGAEVLDVRNGLVWQRCSVGSRWDGNGCTGTAREFAFAEVQHLSTGSWRVPIRNELVSLMQEGKNLGTLNTAVFPGPEHNFWTTSLRSDDPRVSWYVNFFLGIPSTMTPDARMPVRLVR